MGAATSAPRLAGQAAEHGEAVAAARRALSLLQSTLESTADGIVVINQQGRMVSYNQRFLRMWQLPAHLLEAADQRPAIDAALAHVADRDAFLAALRQARAHPEGESFEVVALADGRIFEHYSIPQHLEGRPVGRVWSFRDVTRRNRAEAALQERLRFERLIAAISARFVNLSAERMDEAIQTALRSIRDFSGAASSFAYLFGGADADQTSAWYSGELILAPSAAESLATRPGGWAAEQLAEFGCLDLASAPTAGHDQLGAAGHDPLGAAGHDPLPAAGRDLQAAGHDPQRAADHDLLRTAGVRSLLLVPLLLGGACRGVLGCCNLQVQEGSREDSFALLQIAAEMFASALERRRAEQAVRASERRYRLLFERNLAGVFRNSATGRTLDCNDAYAKILGYAGRHDCIGTSVEGLYLDRQQREQVVRRLREEGSVNNEEIALRRIDGDTVWVLANLNWLDGRDGEPELIDGTVVDITQRKVAESRIVYQAYHDALTDLPNRLLFHDRLTQALAQARRHGHGLAVLFMDLDQFKLVNDTLGHSAGDRLLQQLALRLTQAVRAEDTVARVGGDEFTILLPHIAQADDAARVAQNILAAVALPAEIEDQRIFLTTSIGIGIFPADGYDAEGLLTSADIAMYRAKDLGRNGYQLCTPALSARALMRLSLEQELRVALERGELTLFYQPQIELGSGNTRGFEALLRWRRAADQIITPDHFIAVAEEARLIVPIGDWVLVSACRQLREWQARGLRPGGVAVNLSPRQFQQQDLVPRVAAILEQAGLDPRCLTLEITEGTAMHNLERTVEVVAALREMGIRIAIDDFGTGHASLSYLQQFAVDVLKIDRCFVAGLAGLAGLAGSTSLPGLACGAGAAGAAGSRGSRAIVNAIIDLAHGLDLEVIAEGVETEEQRRFLADRSCDAYQGFLTSRPVPAALAERFLDRPAGP
ncbi:MAG TPA: EAL domain-containing protein [Thermoanaerobaculia bacterium]|nr:EAL domain-containing protein [Thermoanaerobaculia bacterium]